MAADAGERRGATEEDGGAFASSVSLARMLYGCDLPAVVRSRWPGVSLDLQRDAPVELPSPHDTACRRVLVARAPMGSGKTTALLKWLSAALAATDMSALVLSCRRSFTRTLARRMDDAGLGFVTYFDSDAYVMTGRPYRRLLVQIESLHRVDEHLINNYDVLVVDEVMSTLGQLYSPTMARLARVDALLARLLRGCPRVLVMDATINAQLVELLVELRGEPSVHVVVSDYATAAFASRRCLVLRHLGAEVAAGAAGAREDGGGDGSEDAARAGSPAPVTAAATTTAVEAAGAAGDSFFGLLGARLAAGDNVCVFSSTLAFSELVARFCARFTPSVLVLNSQRPPEDVGRWAVRALVYTTVVTVGLSFDAPHFHSMFAYVKPMAHGPDMASVYQSTGRVRRLLRDELFVYVDGSGARGEPIFTPVLLNHVVGAGWPARLSQVTNLVCAQFQRRCRPAFAAARGMRLFSRFKFKHLFERCTLTSVNDSLNILHALLENNRLRVALEGCEPPLTARAFCDFLRDARLDAFASQQVLRQLRPPDRPVAADIADSGEVATFVEKYLVADVPEDELQELLRALANPVTREQFVGLAVLGACARVPEALRSERVFGAVYGHYASGAVPVVADGRLELAALAPDFNVPARWALTRRCARVAEAAGLFEGASPEVDSAAVAAAAADAELAPLLLEVLRCHVLDATTAARRPVRAALSALGAGGGAGPLSRGRHAALVFKVMWEEAFGVRVGRSRQTFPGPTRVKNLRKAEIAALLRDAGLDPPAGATHRQLDALLMERREDLAGERYKLRLPAWSRLMYLTQGGFDAPLDAALSLVPAEAWPRIEGAVDFAAL